MEKKKTIYTALMALLLLPSCAQEGPGEGPQPSEESRISFRSTLPAVTQTRAGVVSNDNFKECRVTCINSDDESLVDPDTGILKPYFPDTRFEQHADGHFLAEDPNTIWPDSKSRLHFFAWYPDTATMNVSAEKGCFSLVNRSTMTGGSAFIDYRLERFVVAPEIADQVDFIAAYATATQSDNGGSPIEMSFNHQLARIELSAWGASERYDFEIAGVRIGNPLTVGDFDFSALTAPARTAYTWLNTARVVPPVEHIFGAGESIVVISKEKGSHAATGEAASIMGKAGPAMVIPMKERAEAWEGKADPRTEEPGYSTDKLYFSVLLRVINRHDEIVYPYPNNCDFIPVTYLAVGSDGKVIRQVYKIGDGYYTADKADEAHRYVPADGAEVKDFCWAALPVSGGARWEAGKIYNYKLNYTAGIGWQDPYDPTPGDPIIERGMVPFEVNVTEWVEAEGHDPNLDVPKR